MEVRTDSKNGVSVASPSDTIKAFEVQTQGCKEQWIQQLRHNPDRFADIEQQINQHYRLGGGQLLASVLAEVSKDPQMDEHIQKTCRDTAQPLRSPDPRSLTVRLVWLGVNLTDNLPLSGEDTKTRRIGYDLLTGKATRTAAVLTIRLALALPDASAELSEIPVLLLHVSPRSPCIPERRVKTRNSFHLLFRSMPNFPPSRLG